MDQDEISRIVGLAEAASAGVTDPEMKTETYKIVLTELLRGAQSPVGNTPNSGHAAHTTQPIQSKPDSAPAKVAAWTGVSEEVLSEVFEFGDTAVTVRLSHNLLPKKISDAQRLLAQLKLSVDKIGYEADEVPAKELIDMFDDHGCKDGNVAKNLKASEYIISKGGKGTMKTYKLRYSGISATLTEIQNVLGATA